MIFVRLMIEPLSSIVVLRTTRCATIEAGKEGGAGRERRGDERKQL